MTKMFVIATTAMLTIAASAASAQAAERPASLATNSAAKDAATAPDTKSNELTGASNAKTRYCVMETLTGSRIPSKACKTRAEWLVEGFDPLAK